MADTALERFKKDQQLQEEKTPPGKKRELDEVQNLEEIFNISEEQLRRLLS